MPTDQNPSVEKLTDQQLLKKVAESEFGGSVDEMLEHFATDSVVPGICIICCGINPSCEPDMEDGLCDECETETTKSILVLAGVI